MAIICRMADGEDWLPGTDLQAARKELREVKDWLTAIQQKKSAPLSLHAKTPTAQEPTDVPKLPRGEEEAGDEGDKVREEAETGKAASPLRSMKKRVSKVSEADQVEHAFVPLCSSLCPPTACKAHHRIRPQWAINLT